MEFPDVITKLFFSCAVLSLGLGCLSIPFMLLTLWKDEWEWGVNIGLSLMGSACTLMGVGLGAIFLAFLFGGVR